VDTSGPPICGLYRDVPPSVCLFSHFLGSFSGGCFGPGFDSTYSSDIIIGI